MSHETLWGRDAVELAQLVRAGAISCREVVQAHLERLTQTEQLNAVVRALPAEALDAADAADRAVRSGAELGPLHGVPVTTKVNTDQAGCPTDNGVVAFRDQIAERDNPIVANLRRAGAIVIGRTNTPAFSMRWFTDNALHGATRNPWSAARTPGGSSGGAAASVAAGVVPIAQGNDIAGSVRYPAYCCGVVGLRPSLARVPAFNFTAPGGRPISSQLMAVQGPLTRRVRDARLALSVLAHGGSSDPRWVDVPLRGPAPPRPIRVSLVPQPRGRETHAAVRAAVEQAGAWLADAGYAVETVEPPGLESAADLWAKIAMDDVIRSLEPQVRTHGDEGIRTALGFWRAINPAGSAQSVLDALGERERLMQTWQLFLDDIPLVVMPVSCEPVFEVGADVRDLATARRIWDAQLPQLAVPVLGLPAVSVPTGLADGLPMGVQIVAGRFREDLCLDAAEIIETRAGHTVPIDPRP